MQMLLDHIKMTSLSLRIKRRHTRTHHWIVDAGHDDARVLTSQERRQIGRVARVDKYRRASPEVLQPFRRPRLGRLGLDGVTKQYGVDHVEPGAERVVRLALASPRIEPERTAPFEDGQNDGDDSGADDNAHPHVTVERLHERVQPRLTLRLRYEEREARIEVRMREVDDAAAVVRDAERRDGHVGGACLKVTHETVPGAALDRIVAVLLVGGDV